MNPITFNFTGAIQNYIVPVTGTYDLSAFGAGGGTGRLGSGQDNFGGMGAEIGGTFALTAGEQLSIIVGGAGEGTNNAGGGGGFSEIYTTDANGAITPLLIAGAGGGGGGRGGGRCRRRRKRRHAWAGYWWWLWRVRRRRRWRRC